MRIEILENGVVVNTIRATEEFAELTYPGAWRIAGVQDEEAQEVQDMRITKLAFRNRFTQSEKVAIEFAALDDPATSMGQRQLSASVRAYLADLSAATFIDLAREDLQEGVESLEAASLIGAGRAEVILSGEIAEIERYRG